jgi:electron transport complex protein RnfD
MEAAKSPRELIVSVSPHVKSEDSVAKIMWTVNLSLLPAFAGSVYFFGWRALYVTALCIVAALFGEWLVEKLTSRPMTLSDGSAFLTGLLLGMNLPPSSPAYIAIIGSLVAVMVAKQMFGGLGFNIFNPALMGRAFVLITWPRAMTTWTAPVASLGAVDAQTTATPLGLLKEEGLHKLLEVFGSKSALYMHLFVGNRAGSLGETSVLLLLIGAAILLLKRYITWHIPLSFVATVGVLTWIFGTNPDTGGLALFGGDPLIHLMSGGLILGAFFMATDYVTVPTIKAGQVIFGVGCGILTVIIRLWGGFPEGVMFSILLMNCFAPLIDRRMRSRIFGYRKVKAA